MKNLLDTNLLVRLVNKSDVDHALAGTVLMKYRQRGDQLCVTAQNMVEFRAVATRPPSANGLGLSSAIAELQCDDFEKGFTFLPDVQAVYLNWKTIVAGSQVLGKHVHDARLVAVAISAGVDAILTFNTVHFQRLCAANGLQLLDPRTI